MPHLSLMGLAVLWILLFHLMYRLCENREPLQYSWEFLLCFRSSGIGPVDSSAVLPVEIMWQDHTGGQRWSSKPMGTRKRGRRGGIRQRLKRLGHRRIPLLTIMLANVQSLRNKVMTSKLMSSFWRSIEVLASSRLQKPGSRITIHSRLED